MELRRVESIQRIPSELEAIKRLQDSFLHDLHRQGYDPDTSFALAIGFSEAVANAFQHGNQRDPRKCITVCYRFERLRAELEVRDEGTGFDPNGVADPTTDSGILRTCGRGMLMMRSLFDEMRYLHGGRLVYLVKRASRTKACAA